MSVYNNYQYYKYQYEELRPCSKRYFLRGANAAQVMKDLFSILKALDGFIRAAYSNRAKARSIYYNNLNYYKKFGGLYPDHGAVSYGTEVIDWLVEVQSDIKDIIKEIKSHERWKYYSELPVLIGFLKESFNC